MSFKIVSSSEESILLRRRKKRIPLLQKSLSIVLASLQGKQIIFELKNDTEVTGIIDSVGHGMDVYIANARVVSCSGTVELKDLMFLSGSSIRYVHFPPDLNVTTHMAAYMKRLENESSRGIPNTLTGRKRKPDDPTPSV